MLRFFFWTLLLQKENQKMHAQQQIWGWILFFLVEHVFAKFTTHLNFCLFFDFRISSAPFNVRKITDLVIAKEVLTKFTEDSYHPQISINKELSYNVQ